MNIRIRKAIREDAHSFIQIKNQLSFKNVNGTTTKGGFLLGTDIETYEQYIENDFCLVAETDEQMIGFGIVLENDTVKQSDIWTRRSRANWTIDIHAFQNQSVCYFEQLAFLNGYSKSVIKLCYYIMEMAFKQHQTLFTTTVQSPILNLAAVPYILKVNGKKIGHIHEEYPAIGNIISDIYMITKVDYFAQLTKTHWGAYLQAQCNEVIR